MRLSTEEKQSLVARYHDGESVMEICADAGVARSTFYTWIKPYTMTTTDSGHGVRRAALRPHHFRKNCRSLPNYMASIVSMHYARPFVFPAVPFTTISSEEKK